MTTTDRELLERAAKAAGYQIDARASFMTWRDLRRLALLNPAGAHTLWNPLEDDGDALRLAVALNLSVMNIKDGEHAFTNVVGSGPKPGNFHDVYEDHNGDSTAATRRAITRAAAAMGGA